MTLKWVWNGENLKFKRLKNRYWSIIRDEIFFRPEHVQFNGIFYRNAGFRVQWLLYFWGLWYFSNEKMIISFINLQESSLLVDKNKWVKLWLSKSQSLTRMGCVTGDFKVSAKVKNHCYVALNHLAIIVQFRLRKAVKSKYYSELDLSR